MKLTPQILAMYMGCQVQFGIKPELFYGCLVGVNIFDSGKALIDAPSERIKHGMPINCSIAIVRPILRRLSDMTKEEAAYIGEIVFGKHDSVKWRNRSERNEKGDIKYFTVYRKYYELFLTIDVPSGEIECYRENKESPGLDDKEIYNNQHKVTAYLLSKSFDLFGLIDAQEAIDAKTLTK